MIVDIEKYRHFTLNQRPCVLTQPRPIFFKLRVEVNKSLKNPRDGACGIENTLLL